MKLILLAIFIGVLTIFVHGQEIEGTKSSQIARPTRSIAWPNTRGTIVRIFKKRSVNDDEFPSNEDSFDRGTRGGNLFLRNSKSISDEISPNEISTKFMIVVFNIPSNHNHHLSFTGHFEHYFV